jgi:hypothetical protein
VTILPQFPKGWCYGHTPQHFTQLPLFLPSIFSTLHSLHLQSGELCTSSLREPYVH